MPSPLYYPGNRIFLKSREGELTFSACVITNLLFTALNIDFWYSKHCAVETQNPFVQPTVFARSFNHLFENRPSIPTPAERLFFCSAVSFLHWFSNSWVAKQMRWDRSHGTKVLTKKWKKKSLSVNIKILAHYHYVSVSDHLSQSLTGLAGMPSLSYFGNPAIDHAKVQVICDSY